jgi:hypothetical protein
MAEQAHGRLSARVIAAIFECRRRELAKLAMHGAIGRRE